MQRRRCAHCDWAALFSTDRARVHSCLRTPHRSKTPLTTCALPAQEYHPKVTPPKAYGPKRVAPQPFVHLQGTGSGQVQKTLVRGHLPGRLGSRAGRLADRPLDYHVSTAASTATVLDSICLL